MNNSTNNKALGTLLTLLGAALWGSCATVSKHLMDAGELDTMWMTNFRMLMSGIILVALRQYADLRQFATSGKTESRFQGYLPSEPSRSEYVSWATSCLSITATQASLRQYSKLHLCLSSLLC